MKTGKGSNNSHLAFVAKCVFVFTGPVHELLQHISEFIGLSYPLLWCKDAELPKACYRLCLFEEPA